MMSSSSSLLPSTATTTISFSNAKKSSPPFLPKSKSFSISSSRFKCSSLQAIAAEPLVPAAAAPAATAPSAAEVARTVVELAPSGTLSVVGTDGWPLGVGARFVADGQGAPALCLALDGGLVAAADGKSSFHVEFEQSGLRTPQCTLLGSLTKPSDEYVLKKLCTRWQKKFGEEIDQDLLYLISVERVFHMEDFKEDGLWVAPSEYISAEPDPLRSFAQKLVEEMNNKHAEDVRRLCNIYVESDFQVADVKIVWVDRLGFDLHIYSEEGVFAARIPFSREVTDEKGVKSSFNMMSHHAWEIEKSYIIPEFERVNLSKKVR